MKLVKIHHPEAGETQVPESAVPHWRSSGWELTSAGDQSANDDAPPQVSQIANAVGYALAQRGVQVTAADAIAAAYRVVDQGLAVRVTATTAGGKEAKDPPDKSSATSEQSASTPGQKAKPSTDEQPTEEKAGQDKPSGKSRRRSNEGD